MNSAMPRPRSFRLRPLEPTEAQIQDAILKALRIHPAVVWASRMNTGAGKLRRCDGTEQWIRFGFPGCSDILGQLRDGRLLAIEAKRPGGRVSAEQKAFLERASRHGALAFVARSSAEALGMLDRCIREQAK